jgi:aldehyde:ferredoxin oxidoreductase
MRKYLQIDLARRSVEASELHGEAIVKAGRYLIAKTLLEGGAAPVDPLSPANPLIFSAGPFAGTTFSNANRISVGCKSPLTGGIKEANAGGTFALALGQLGVAGFTLAGASEAWVVLRLTRDGKVLFDDATPYLGLGNDRAAAALVDAYGRDIAFGLCGPVGERLGLIAGIGFSDREFRPSRLAARGGVGAVMGSKKVKAVVVDLDKAPPLHDRKAGLGAGKKYAVKLGEQPVVKSYREQGTAFVADITNYSGGLPVRNFSSGQMVDRDVEPLRIGGHFIREQQTQRGGQTEHPCMPGCVIQCSNVYVDASGKELASPVEYETLSLLGTNLGLADPDDVARLNAAANDLGVDTIELGATLGVMMEAGLAPFGDMAFLLEAVADLRQGNERGRLIDLGAARVGERLGVKRVPVVKKQSLSAYDPRVIEVTGVTMMVSAQGADHTAGNLPFVDCKGKTAEELAALSFGVQCNAAVTDSLGLCIFGRSVHDVERELIAEAVNAYHGTAIDARFFDGLAKETLRMERSFNRAAGLGEADDALPAFFYDEPLPPTGKRVRFAAAEINAAMNKLLD